MKKGDKKLHLHAKLAQSKKITMYLSLFSYINIKTCFRARVFISTVLRGKNIWIAKIHNGLKIGKKCKEPF